MSDFVIDDTFLIPVEPGQAVDAGWTAATGGRPLAVTWHWTATWDLAACTRLLGGADAERKGVASAHYGVGRSFAEGVHRYVALGNRSWHAGKNQTLRWNGDAHSGQALKGSRTAVGVETVNIGYARPGIPSEDDWLPAASPDGRWHLRIQPWSDEQVAMMATVGREIVARWPHIGPDDHHGHHDLCPGYKVDPVAFPFARVLRAIYDDPGIPDVWTPLWTVRARHRALRILGYDPTDDRAAGSWRAGSDAALRRLQRDHGLVEDGNWTTFVNRRVWQLFDQRGLALEEVGS